jgi:hypothetical protein
MNAYWAVRNSGDIIPIREREERGEGKRREEKGREENLDRRFNALSWASQVHSSGNSRDILPIKPATNPKMS